MAEGLIVTLVVLLLLALFAGPIVFSAMAWARIRRVERRLDALDRCAERGDAAPERVPEMRFPAAPPPPVAAPAGVPAPSDVPAPVPPPAPLRDDEVPPPLPSPAPLLSRPAGRAAGARSDFESFVGGRVLLVGGVVAVLCGLGFFLKLAIDREWIGPGARIATGVVAGLAAIAGGHALRRRGFDVFGQAIMGGGVAALFLCDWASSVRYDWYDRPAAFVVAGAVTAFAAWLAVARAAPLLAWIAFAGAFAAPAFLGRNEDAVEGLTLWLGAVDVGVLVVLAARNWHGLDALAAFATSAYFLAWDLQWAKDDRRLAGAACLAVLAVVILAVAYAPAALARRRLGPGAVLAAVVGTVAAYGIGIHMFHPQSALALGAAVLGLAAAHAVAAAALRSRGAPCAEDAPLLVVLALGTASLSVPVFLEEAAVGPAWAMFGVVAVWAAVRAGAPGWMGIGLASIAVGAVQILVERMPLHTADFVPFLNVPWLSAVAPAVALAAVALWITRLPDPMRIVPPGLVLAAALLDLFVLVTAEILVWGEEALIGGLPRADVRHWAQVGLSGAWALMAAALVVSGFRFGRPALRWCGIGLFAVTSGKVFLVDTERLSTPLRVGSFLVLGVLLVGASYLYQRARKADAPPPA